MRVGQNNQTGKRHGFRTTVVYCKFDIFTVEPAKRVPKKQKMFIKTDNECLPTRYMITERNNMCVCEGCLKMSAGETKMTLLKSDSSLLAL